MFVFLNYSRTSRIFFWVNVILHQEKQEVYACLATAKEIRSECWSRSGFSKGWMVLRQQKSNTEGFPCAKKYDFGKSFVKPCSTIDNADGWFISKIGFHFPSIWMGCHVIQIQQVSWDVLSAILGSNNLNESVSDDAGRHGATLRCASQHPDDKTHGSRYRWLFCIPPCAFFFPMTGGAQRLHVFARSSCLLRPWMRCFLPHCDTAGPFAFVPASADRVPTSSVATRLMCKFPSASSKPSVVWSQYRQMADIYFLHKWCTEKKKTLAQLVHGSVLITLILILQCMEAERKRPY